MTGTVLDPVILYEEDEVIIHARVESLPDGAYTCPGNEIVPVVIELAEPIGDRELVDGVCREGEYAEMPLCLDSYYWPES